MFDTDPYSAGREFSQIIGRMLVFSLFTLIPYIFYLVQLQRLMRQVSPDVRRLNPDSVWLLLIPCFRWVWCFFVVTRIGDSLREEQKRRGILEFDERPGFAIGMAMACLSVGLRLLAFLDTTALTGLLALALLSCWIVYWVKMAGYERRLKQSGAWQHYSTVMNPYYQQAWPQPQWPQQNPAQQPDWERTGFGQPWQQPVYPAPPPPTANPMQQQPAWAPPTAPPTVQAPAPVPPAASPWQPPAAEPPTPPKPSDPEDYSRWMPPGNS